MPIASVRQKEKGAFVPTNPPVAIGFEQLFSTMSEAVAVHELVRDARGRVVDYRYLAVNPAFERLAGLSSQGIVGHTVSSVFKSRPQWIDRCAPVAETGTPIAFETGAAPFKGYYLINVFSPGPNRFATVFTDITARMTATLQLEATLKERDVLLKELYHRTKNNLQFVSGLIALQVEGSEDEKYRGLLEALELKIQGMAVVHRRLYESSNLELFKLKDYIEELATSVLSSCTAGFKSVQIKVDCANLESGDNAAIAIGLIINESLQNVAKYAFGPGKKGKIGISLRPLADSPDLLELRITDNGQGLPKDFEERRRHSTGLSLVEALVKERLGGTLSFETGKGTTCRAVFPASSLSAR